MSQIIQHVCRSNFGRTHDCWCARNRDHSESDHKRDMALEPLKGT